MEETKKEEASAKKRSFCRCKKFGIAAAVIAVAICAKYGYEKLCDKPLKIAETTSPDAKPDYANGVGIDFIKRFNLRQERDVWPAEENGWKDLLQAFGPIFLEQQHAWQEIPWEEFPIKCKVWFDGYWTPLCEKYGIDPNVKPVFWDRMDVQQYLIKNGITGEETPPDITFDGGELYDYWENHEKKIGVASWKAVEETLASSRERPWTAEEYPNLEKWLEENADMFDAVAAAVRKPRFRCWHFPGGGATSDAEAEPGAYIATLLPEVQSLRSVSRLCSTRANYRVGKGDFSGAIDDIETILLVGKSLMEGDNRTLVERLVGIAVTGIAAAIALDANPNASPSPEERARLVAIWKDAFDATDYTEWGREWVRDEMDNFWTPMAQLFVQSLRKGKYTLTVFSGEFEGDVADNGAHSLFERPPRFWIDTLKIKSGANKRLLFRGGFDDAAFMREIESLDRAAAEGDNQALERTWEELERSGNSEKKTAAEFHKLICPSTVGVVAAAERMGCYVNTVEIVNAILAYNAEKGTLPPAFTIDANGKPLHSWRVLILPYLGEEEKALYEKIKLDEPWDSEYNKQLLTIAPKVYRCPSNRNCGEGQTTFSAILGDGAFFDASGVGKNLGEFYAREGFITRVQALICERREPIEWARPDAELTLEEIRATFGLDAKSSEGGAGSLHSGGMQVGTAGGAARFVSESEAGFKLEKYLTGVPEPKEDEQSKPE